MLSELTAQGVIFVTIAWTTVIGLAVFCAVKVLTSNNDLSEVEE